MRIKNIVTCIRLNVIHPVDCKRAVSSYHQQIFKTTTEFFNTMQTYECEKQSNGFITMTTTDIKERKRGFGEKNSF